MYRKDLLVFQTTTTNADEIDQIVTSGGLAEMNLFFGCHSC